MAILIIGYCLTQGSDAEAEAGYIVRASEFLRVEASAEAPGLQASGHFEPQESNPAQPRALPWTPLSSTNKALGSVTATDGAGWYCLSLAVHGAASSGRIEVVFQLKDTHGDRDTIKYVDGNWSTPAGTLSQGTIPVRVLEPSVATSVARTAQRVPILRHLFTPADPPQCQMIRPRGPSQPSGPPPKTAREVWREVYEEAKADSARCQQELQKAIDDVARSEKKHADEGGTGHKASLDRARNTREKKRRECEDLKATVTKILDKMPD